MITFYWKDLDWLTMISCFQAYYRRASANMALGKFKLALKDFEAVSNRVHPIYEWQPYKEIPWHDTYWIKKGIVKDVWEQGVRFMLFDATFNNI